MKPYYITTTLPYVNAEPHIGFAWEIITADVLARFHKVMGCEVIFNTGTDEHGQKIYNKAVEAGISPQEYVDGYAAKFRELSTLLNLSVTHFIRTTDPHHVEAAQAFWKRCADHGDIYKKIYKTKYCVGCELEKTDSELVDNHCPLHPQIELEIREEENYFFKFSAYQQALLDLYKNQPDFVVPKEKLAEITSFVAGGLQDFSISRLKEKMPWGIEVPGDPNHVMYVWFDALINYISTLGWPDSDTFTQFWPGVQIAGKDNLRQQSAMWQAMLLSAQLPPARQILINGFISVNGEKMSKSFGNVISPVDMVKRYGIDGTRYLLLSLGPVSGDMDVTWEKFDHYYNGYLANSLGNTVSRIANLCARAEMSLSLTRKESVDPAISEALETYRFDLALESIWNRIKNLEKVIDEKQPWKLSGSSLELFLRQSGEEIIFIATQLQMFMPDTAEQIIALFTAEKITPPKPLFPRLS